MESPNDVIENTGKLQENDVIEIPGRMGGLPRSEWGNGSESSKWEILIEANIWYGP